MQYLFRVNNEGIKTASENGVYSVITFDIEEVLAYWLAEFVCYRVYQKPPCTKEKNNRSLGGAVGFRLETSVNVSQYPIQKFYPACILIAVNWMLLKTA